MNKISRFLYLSSLAILGLTTHSWTAMVPQQGKDGVEALRNVAGAIPRHNMTPRLNKMPGGMIPRGDMNFNDIEDINDLEGGELPRGEMRIRKLTPKERAHIILLDLCCAYGLSMALILCHELGHGITTKLLCSGSSFGITLGAYDTEGHLNERLGKLRIMGLNPFIGHASMSCRPEERSKEVIISLAGPIYGTFASYTALTMIRKAKGKLPITEFAALFALGTNAIDNLLLGPLIPGSDTHAVVKLLCPKLLNYLPDLSSLLLALLPKAFKS